MTDHASAARAAVDAATTDLTALLSSWVTIPSCAFPDFPAEPVLQQAEACLAALRNLNMPEVTSIDYGARAPAVIGRDHRAGPTAPTVLLYAHYDVQPPLADELWQSAPYDPVERDGRLFGRGAADDKAGLIACYAAVKAWYDSAEQLPVNVTVFWEGEEEIGSPNLGTLLQRERELLRADAVVVCDMVNVAVGVPSLTVSLRGMACGTIRVQALDHAMHSGMWGGVLPDAAGILADLLATIRDHDGILQLPGLTTPNHQQR